MTINDGAFEVQMTPPGSATGVLIDHPATYHNNASSLSFADGHSVLHKWLSPYIRMTVTSSSAPAFLTDVEWLSSVTSVLE